MAFLECRDVYKIYKEMDSLEKVPALRGIELDVNKSELIAIIGSSGSGKSTLIKMIGAIEYPTAGKVTIDNTEITRLNKKQRTLFRRKNLGFLYQTPDRNLFWNLSALNNVMLPMKIICELSKSEKIRKALELLDSLGLKKRKDHKPWQLSGGEAQRVAIAVSLANDPSIILADEPTGELDSTTTFEIIDYFRILNQEYGKTFIVVTHDNRFSKLTNKALRIQDGRIVSLHRAKSQIDLKTSVKTIERENFIFVDEHGNVRIPEDIRKKCMINNYVNFEIRNGVASIIPYKEAEKKIEKRNP